MVGWYEISESQKGRFSFVLKATNGQVILRSQQYAAKDSAVKGIASVQANAAIDTQYELLDASVGRPLLQSHGCQQPGRRYQPDVLER